jgi:cAMP phosphodiesterase
MRKEPFQVYTHKTVVKIIKDHLFNDVVWPDFCKLPNEKNPTIVFHELEPEKTFSLMDYRITPVLVQHPNDAMGFIVEDKSGAVLFTVDTASTDRIWEVAKSIKNIKAIFTEVSFPNALEKVAKLSDHHTPATLTQELKKMPQDIPVILTHLKPNFRNAIIGELAVINNPRVRVLENDGEVFDF